MVGLPGAAHLALADGVVHLDPASAVFEAMPEGCATQQRARFLKTNTIGPRLELVRRFAAFTNQYPWQWEPAEAEAFITHSPVAVSTARNYQNTLRLFCGYASDARYGWAAKCLEQFGSAPWQILRPLLQLLPGRVGDLLGLRGNRPCQRVSSGSPICRSCRPALPGPASGAGGHPCGCLVRYVQPQVATGRRARFPGRRNGTDRSRHCLSADPVHAGALGFGVGVLRRADVAWVTDELGQPGRIAGVLAARARWELNGGGTGVIALGLLGWAVGLPAAIVASGAAMALLGVFVAVRFPEDNFTPVQVRRWARRYGCSSEGLPWHAGTGRSCWCSSRRWPSTART